jgi:gas vesicle protein
MGVFDKARDATDKAKDVTEENVDKLDGVIDKAADKVDEKTGGKHSEKINQVVDAIQDPAHSAATVEEPPSPPEP